MADEPRRGRVYEPGIAPIDRRVAFLPAQELYRQAKLLNACQRHADTGRLPGAATAGPPRLLGHLAAVEDQLAVGVNPDGDGAIQGPAIRPHPGRETAAVPCYVVDHFAVGRHAQAVLEALPARVQLPANRAGIRDDPARVPLGRQVVEADTWLFGCIQAAGRQEGGSDET